MRLVALFLLLLGFAHPLPDIERATLWVEVVSEDTGAPIHGVQLVITRAAGQEPRVKSVGPLDGGLGRAPNTGSDGRARFRLQPGAYSLHVSWGNERRSIGVPELADGEERTLRVELPTLDDLRFLGRVLVREPSGKVETPLAGAEVLLYEESFWDEAWQRITETESVEELIARTTSDANGCFEVLSVSWKNRMVRVRAPGAFRIEDLPGETSWYLGPDPGDRKHADLVPEGTPLTLPAGAREHRVELHARTR